MTIFMYKYILIIVVRSGVVGRERMGTAFPHKKLSGNGVPTREILRFCLLLLNKLFPTVTMLQHSVHLKPCHNWTSEFAKYLEH